MKRSFNDEISDSVVCRQNDSTERFSDFFEGGSS